MKKNEALWAREAAISFHNDAVEWFVQQYGRNQPGRGQGSAFLYGRRQIDSHFMREIAALPPRAKVLDVGCGTGEQIKRLVEAGFEVNGVEPSDRMRAYAQSRLPPGAVAQGSVLGLPFEDERFEFVYAIEVFRYLAHEDNIQGLREIYRVLKPGGAFFGTFVNQYALDGFAIWVGIHHLIAKWRPAAQKCHTEFETPGSLEEMLRAVGFSNVETRGAMIAPLRAAYKLARPLGVLLAELLEPIDADVTDKAYLRRYAGHLLGIARK